MVADEAENEDVECINDQRPKVSYQYLAICKTTGNRGCEMATCDKCTEEVEHSFQCSYCEESFCGQHRLPENHQCPQFTTDSTVGTFSSSSPNITDRRGTWGRMVSRVRDKETEKWEKKTDPNPRGETKRDLSTDSEAAIFNCPECGGKAAALKEATCCGKSMCYDCRESHNCDSIEEEREEEQFERSGLLRRFLDRL